MNAVLKEMMPGSAAELAEQARKLSRKGEDIVHLDACEPDCGIHPLVAAALKAALLAEYDARRKFMTARIREAYNRMAEA